MSDLEPRRRSGVSRKARESRAYSLVLVTGGLALLTIVLLVLAVFSVAGVGFGTAFVAALLTGGSGLLLRRTLNS